MSKPYTVDGEPAYDSRFIGIVDLRGKDHVVEIADVGLESLRSRKGHSKKPILTLKGWEKQWAIPATVADTIAKLYGKEMRGWVGKRVHIFPDPNVTFGNEKPGGVRVRPVVPKDEPTPAPASSTAPVTAAARGKDEL